jgi:Response regulator containing CheY-like receiver, AAA-type ATPase, and DNA-binding domains
LIYHTPVFERQVRGVVVEYGACTVLVIEDEVVTRSASVRLLRQLGVGTVIEAADGAEALARCDRMVFDAIFCDVDMTPMSGLAFIEALRGRDRAISRNAPVIMLTKHAESDVVHAALRSGATGYLVKPLTSEWLRQKLQKALATK